MNRVVSVVCFCVVLALLGAAIIQTADLIANQAAQIRDLQQRNAVLVDRAAKWEKLAKDFEALNRQCLQITFGGGR